jgi:hypothetical protein
MSRIDDCEPDDNEGFLRACAFDANGKRAILGRRGQKFMRELEAALLELPEKKLAAGVLTRPPATMVVCGFEVLRFDLDFHERGEYCALGAVALKRAMDSGKEKLDALRELNQNDPDDDDDEYSMGYEKIDEAAYLLGIPTPLAWKIVCANDESAPDDPAKRWAYMLQWVRSRIRPRAGWATLPAPFEKDWRLG